FTHVSLCVHALPSLHEAPVFGVCVHPCCGSQPSFVQASPSSQLTGEPVQMPAAQVSSWVHALPSLHAAPVFGACWHPCCASHVSFVQTSPSSQLTGEPVQTPAAHLSFWVHALPSLHAAPVFGACWHPSCASHVSFVQT